MSFWEVSVDHSLIAEERSEDHAIFHASLDASLSMAATELHSMLKSLLLFAVLALLSLVSFVAPSIEPLSANLCLYFTGIFAFISLHHCLAPFLTAP